MTHCPPPAAPPLSQDDLWRDALPRYGRDIARFAAGDERDPARRQELLQEVQVALWQSFAGFRGQCALRTWVYRVAHNVGATHVQRSTRDIERACSPSSTWPSSSSTGPWRAGPSGGSTGSGTRNPERGRARTRGARPV